LNRIKKPTMMTATPMSGHKLTVVCIWISKQVSTLPLVTANMGRRVVIRAPSCFRGS
jgi:hypothetical protein